MTDDIQRILERLARAEARIDSMERGGAGMRAEPGANTLGQDTRINGALTGGTGNMRLRMSLREADFYCSFDGGKPYNKNFTGAKYGSRGQAPTWENLIHRPGKFGKGLQIAAPTTNYILNPDFEYDTANWTFSGAGTYGREDYPEIPFLGDWCLLLNNKTARANPKTVNGGETWTFSAWVQNKTAGISTSIQLVSQYTYTVLATAASDPNITGWQRIVLTLQMPATILDDLGSPVSTYQVYPELVNASASAALFDCAQFEQLAYASPICLSTMGPGHSAGVNGEHIRAQGYISYSIEGESLDGTLAFWYKPDTYTAGRIVGSVFSLNLDASGYPILAHGAIGAEATAQGIEPLSLTEFSHIVITWSNDLGIGRLYVNGAYQCELAYATTDKWLSFAWPFWPILMPTENEAPGLYDDALALDYALSEEEVFALWYSESAAAVDWYEQYPMYQVPMIQQEPQDLRSGNAGIFPMDDALGQRWMAQMYQGDLQQILTVNARLPLPAAPSVALVATSSGNCTNGVHKAAGVYVDNSGHFKKTTPGAWSANFTIDSTHKQAVITAPAFPPGVYSMDVYVTKAGESVGYYLGNIGTSGGTLTYNTADGGLTDLAPTANETRGGENAFIGKLGTEYTEGVTQDNTTGSAYTRAATRLSVIRPILLTALYLQVKTAGTISVRMHTTDVLTDGAATVLWDGSVGANSNNLIALAEPILLMPQINYWLGYTQASSTMHRYNSAPYTGTYFKMFETYYGTTLSSTLLPLKLVYRPVTWGR